MLPTLRTGGWITSAGREWLRVWRVIVAGTKGGSLQPHRVRPPLDAGVRAGQADVRPGDRDAGAMTGGPVAEAALKSVLWAIGIVVVFAPLAVRVYRRKT
jgi:hypothetical protein